MFVRNLFSLKKYTFSKLSIIRDRFQLPEKWKGGRIEKWSIFWKNLVEDYKTVATDVIQGAQTKPYKAACVTAGLGMIFTAVKTNPDEQSFYDNLIQCVSTLTMVSDPVKNPTSEQHIQFLIRCQNQGLLRKNDLIFFTIIWVADYSKDTDIYAAQCKYLQPRYLTFYQRIIDIGLYGTWWNLKRKMIDYDINPNEWSEMT